MVGAGYPVAVQWNVATSDSTTVLFSGFVAIAAGTVSKDRGHHWNSQIQFYLNRFCSGC